MKVVLTRLAVGDVEEACAHYAGIDPELATRFVEGVDGALKRIAMFPRGAPLVEGFDDLRRARMSRFPYGIFYQQTPAGGLLVVRVLHSRRHHPGVIAVDPSHHSYGFQRAGGMVRRAGPTPIDATGILQHTGGGLRDRL